MARVDVTMPKMGESITEGTVITWHKQVGDQVELDETLLEIGTDKVDTEVPSPAAGNIAEILVPEGDTVDVGAIIARIETDVNAAVSAAPAPATPAAAPEKSAGQPASGEDKRSPIPELSTGEMQAFVEVTEPEPSRAPAAPAPVAAPPPALASSSGSGASVDVVMPKMGESIVEGTIITWHKKPGDRIEMDETLLEIATDKVDTEVPSPAAGVVRELLFNEGDVVEVGVRIAVIASDAEAGAATHQPSAPALQPAQAAAPRAAAPQDEVRKPSGDGAVQEPVVEEAGPIERKGSDGRFYSPLVRSIAEKEGVSMRELEGISGSGREGRVTKEDLLKYVESRTSQPAPGQPAPRPTQPAQPAAAPRPAPAARPQQPSPTRSEHERGTEIIEMDRMRQIIAEHMVRSKATSAHVTSFAECDVTNLVKLRERSKAAFEAREGVRLTYTPFFIQACIESLREHPIMNASVEEKRIVLKKDYHIGIAVAIGKKGLLAPIIRSAGDMNLVGLARYASDLAERARNKQLNPDELSGGTFTITNIGSLGSLMGTPIINQPQVAILATGAIKKRPVVIEDPNLGDIIAIRHMMYLSLSYDHRIIDGAMAASFLHRFVQVVEAVDPNGEI